MTLTSPRSSNNQNADTTSREQDRSPVFPIPHRPLLDEFETVETTRIDGTSLTTIATKKIDIPSFLSYENHIASLDTKMLPVAHTPLEGVIVAPEYTVSPPSTFFAQYRSVPVPATPAIPPIPETPAINTKITTEAALSSLSHVSPAHVPQPFLTRRSALFLIMLLGIFVFQAVNTGSSQFMGPQGWAYVLSGNGNQANLLRSLNKTFTSPAQASGTRHAHRITPQQYIDMIVQNMSLNQKLGQMMLVQFNGPDYSLDLSTMVEQQDVGAVLIFAANQNIQSKTQLHGLIQQIQHGSQIPLAVSIDQEGGTVDRLASLDGPRPSATTLGATGNPQVAMRAGIQDAQDLTFYGINLNLAPVVDVTNVYNPQLDQRTFGNNAALVTHMAGAYLKGLQQSGKVLGTLKHFPGLGDVGVDPHSGVPYLNRSRGQLEQIDWSPYRTLIAQGNVHAVMVTHEIVQAVDSSKPSSLSYKVVTGILRNDLGFQGVVITDSLTMEGITAYYDESQAAALAVEAGCDLLMGASTPSDVAAMIQGIKQAMSSGQISQQRINDSVHRILMMKYAMGLLPLPA